jgi:hypothetical protein
MLRLFDSRIESNLRVSVGFAIMHGSIKLHAAQQARKSELSTS